MSIIMHWEIAPHGMLLWRARRAIPLSVIVNPKTDQRINQIRSLNDSGSVGTLSVHRNQEDWSIAFVASEGVRFAYKDKRTIRGDLTVWEAFHYVLEELE